MKNIKFVLIGLLVVALFAGCGKTVETEELVLKVGATPVPHAEILEIIKDDLAEEGIKLEVVEFTDYVTPNLALNDGEIDANFFQHAPYLESFNKDHDLSLISVGTVHVEPLGLYSDKFDSVEALEKGATIAIPSDAVNGGRALILLASNGLIKLADDAGLEATDKDIVENINEYVFKSIEAAQLPRVLVDVDAAVINGNYAIEAGLNPLEDGLIVEGPESPYANIVTVNGDKANDEVIGKLLNALQSEEVETFITEKYEGSVIPAFN